MSLESTKRSGDIENIRNYFYVCMCNKGNFGKYFDKTYIF